MSDDRAKILRSPFGLRYSTRSTVKQLHDGWVVMWRGRFLARRWPSEEDAQAHLESLKAEGSRRA